MYSLGFAIIAIILLSLWGFKKFSPLAWAFNFAVSLITGLVWYDVFDTNEALVVSMFMIVFAFACFAESIACIFIERKPELE